MNVGSCLDQSELTWTGVERRKRRRFSRERPGTTQQSSAISWSGLTILRSCFLSPNIVQFLVKLTQVIDQIRSSWVTNMD